MKTDTKNKILALIKRNSGIRAYKITQEVGFTKAVVFRHLKDLIHKNEIIKIGKPPKVNYFYINNMDQKTSEEENLFRWAITGSQKDILPEKLSPTRDVFQARLEKSIKELSGLLPEEVIYLLVAGIGEIGNNSFDHNLGRWIDVPGVLFSIDKENRNILLADRGQGVYNTLKKVRPDIKNHKEALKVAFTEIISGRAPEKRGNGLKYVKKIIIENNWYLKYYSGDMICSITGDGMRIEKSKNNIPGTLIIIKF